MDEVPPPYFEALKERVTGLMNGLNNQVAIGSGFLQFLKDDNPRLTPQQRQWLETISASSEKAIAILKDLHSALLG